MSKSPSSTIETPTVLVHGAFADSSSWNSIINWLLSGELLVSDLADPRLIGEPDDGEVQFTLEMTEPGGHRWPLLRAPARTLI